MLETKAQIVINKPIDEVFDYTANPVNAKDWYDNVKTSEWATENSQLEVGAKAKLLTNIMGKDIHFLYEFKKVIPNELILMSASAGAFPMESEYLFGKVSDTSTEVTVITRAEPKGVPTFMLNMVKGKVQKTSEEDVQTLKKIIESQ